MAWLHEGEKKIEDMFTRFDTTHERDRRTHRHTDRHVRMTTQAALAQQRAAKNNERKILRVSPLPGSLGRDELS